MQKSLFLLTGKAKGVEYENYCRKRSYEDRLEVAGL